MHRYHRPYSLTRPTQYHGQHHHKHRSKLCLPFNRLSCSFIAKLWFTVTGLITYNCPVDGSPYNESPVRYLLVRRHDILICNLRRPRRHRMTARLGHLEHDRRAGRVLVLDELVADIECWV